MKQRVTLRQAVQMLGEQGIVIDWDGMLTMEDFLSYYDHHYEGALQRGVYPKNTFLIEDILQIFK